MQSVPRLKLSQPRHFLTPQLIAMEVLTSKRARPRPFELAAARPAGDWRPVPQWTQHLIARRLRSSPMLEAELKVVSWRNAKSCIALFIRRSVRTLPLLVHLRTFFYGP